MSSSPPSYSSSPTALAQPYPQPSAKPPSFRQRKSATIISVTSSSSSEASISPSTSPERSTRSLPVDSPLVIQSRTRSGERDRLSRHAKTNSDSVVFDDMADGAGSSRKDGLPAYLKEHTLERRYSNSSSAAEEGEGTETTLLLGNGDKLKWWQTPLFVASFRLSILFLIFTAVVAGTFWFGLPQIDPKDRALLKLPRSFADLQMLNGLFQKYKKEFPMRILSCGVVTYLFVQTFSLPGSMYVAIVFGAAYGLIAGVLLSCLCESVGSVLCYILSSILAPPLLTIPFYRARVETWRIKIMGDPAKGKQLSWLDLFAFLTVLRITPFPPHWVVNLVAPHLGIGLGMFWLSVFIGIMPVCILHVAIGTSLDTMTSADDIHILSVRNVLGMIAVVVAILIPVGLKRVFKKDLGDLELAEEAIEEQAVDAEEVIVPPMEDTPMRRYQAVDSGLVLAGPSQGDSSFDIATPDRKGKGKSRVELIADIREEEDEDPQETYESFRAEVSQRWRDDVKLPRASRGYGTIPIPPTEMEGATPRETTPFWRFAR